MKFQGRRAFWQIIAGIIDANIITFNIMHCEMKKKTI